jgi:hypothetical protein
MNGNLSTNEKLFIIDGAMRPAKNELVRHLTKLEKNLTGGQVSTVCLAKKICTKDGGDDQDYTYVSDLNDLISKNEKEWISYTYEGNTYALKKAKLDDIIKEHDITFLIARNTEFVFELKNKYERHTIPVKVITVYIYSDKKAIEASYNKEKKEGEPPLGERKKRLARSDIDYENAMALSENYDETLIYTRKDERGSASLAVKINSLINKYKNIIEPYSIFFIQSFNNEENNAVNMYESLQKAAEKAFGDENRDDCIGLIKGRGSYKIGETIWEMIDRSDFIVCDITPDRCKDCEIPKIADRSNLRVSPNIWLELGYTLFVMKSRNIKIGKKLIVTCKQEDNNEKLSLPTDICDINVITYKNNEDFAEQVSTPLKGLK